MSGHPGAVLCGRGHGAVDHAVQGHGQLLVGHPEVVKGQHFLAADRCLPLQSDTTPLQLQLDTRTCVFFGLQLVKLASCGAVASSCYELSSGCVLFGLQLVTLVEEPRPSGAIPPGRGPDQLLLKLHHAPHHGPRHLQPPLGPRDQRGELSHPADQHHAHIPLLAHLQTLPQSQDNHPCQETVLFCRQQSVFIVTVS